MKKRIDQSRDSLKIVRKDQNNREVSTLLNQQAISARDRDRARTLTALLEANAKCNAERRESAKNDFWRIVEDSNMINPDLRKELPYS